MLAEYVTFSLSNMAAFHRINAVEVGMLLPGTIIALIGIGSGVLSRYLGRRLGVKLAE